MRTRHSGFTLIELSIVLVIIGLIIGGILYGNDLIRAAKVRTAISDLEKLNSSVLAFRNKYDCLPGDCAKATNFWTTWYGGCNPVYVGAQKSIAAGSVCNGNGNDKIDNHEELLLFWQMMTNANFASFRPDFNVGMYATSGYAFPLFPFASPFSNGSAVGLFDNPNIYRGAIGTDAGSGWRNVSGRYWVVGKDDPWGGNCKPAISAIDTMAIDSKIDDGRPTTGNVFGDSSDYGQGCNNPYSTPILYTPNSDLTVGSSGCVLYQKASF